jgi:hypothetical protein
MYIVNGLRAILIALSPGSFSLLGVLRVCYVYLVPVMVGMYAYDHPLLLSSLLTILSILPFMESTTKAIVCTLSLDVNSSTDY